jgi:uncharacterized protein YjbI with pentapeptide repeats
MVREMMVLGIVGATLLLGMFALYAYAGYVRGHVWTGLPTRPDAEDAPSYVTLWSWLGLLIVPLTLAVGSIGFSYAQQQRDGRIEAERYENELRIQERRAQDAALQSYLDKMSTLLVEHDLNSRTVSDKESILAQAYTASLLEVAGPRHKRSALVFLYESNLVTKNNEIVDLSQAHLEGADLTSLYLWNAELSDIYLNGARLSGAYCVEASLVTSILRDADLSGAELNSADLSNTDLRNTDLSGAVLTPLEGENGKPIPTRLQGAYLEDANLDGTKLQGVDLRGAKNLEQDQLNKAEGDAKTLLPAHLRRPASWDR